MEHDDGYIPAGDAMGSRPSWNTHERISFLHDGYDLSIHRAKDDPSAKKVR